MTPPAPTRQRRRTVLSVAALVVCVAVPFVTPADRSDAKERVAPLVFGHRGASGYRPEHTLASYDLAVRLGADVVEPDLVSTKDHVLVARHENEISGTTDVAEHREFADRKATKTIDGNAVTGWFTEDFTLAELRTLRAKERLPKVREENTLHDGRYQVPTFDEVLDLAEAAGVGVAPETKHPSYFDAIGLSLEEPLVAALRRHHLDKKDSPVYVQSFESDNLRELRAGGLRVHLVQLTSASGSPFSEPRTYAAMTTPAGLADVASYADWLGPDKAQLFPRAADGTTSSPTSLVRDAHAAGLQVVPYTYRAENQFLPAQYRRGTDPNAYGDVLSELREAYRAGVDGVFTDQADLGRIAREDVGGS